MSNTGGILVFNMPGIPKRGYGTRVFDNDVRDNNTANFAAPALPFPVSRRSGIMVNSNDQVEIFNNRISGNQTANILSSPATSVPTTPASERLLTNSTPILN